MGKPKFSRKKYDTPNHPWKEERIKAENELIKKYGLKNKREIWKAATALRKYRGQARELLAKTAAEDPQAKKETGQLISHLTRYSILPLNSTLDDVLALETESILARRLQTISYLKGFASTPHQARQLICHGHIAIDGNRITVPGYRVTKDEEGKIEYAIDSPLNDVAHPARPTGEFKSKLTVTTAEVQQGKEPETSAKPPVKQPAPPKKPTQKPEEKTVEEKKEPETKVAEQKNVEDAPAEKTENQPPAEKTAKEPEKTNEETGKKDEPTEGGN